MENVSMGGLLVTKLTEEEFRLLPEGNNHTLPRRSMSETIDGMSKYSNILLEVFPKTILIGRSVGIKSEPGEDLSDDLGIDILGFRSAATGNIYLIRELNINCFEMYPY